MFVHYFGCRFVIVCLFHRRLSLCVFAYVCKTFFSGVACFFVVICLCVYFSLCVRISHCFCICNCDLYLCVLVFSRGLWVKMNLLVAVPRNVCFFCLFLPVCVWQCPFLSLDKYFGASAWSCVSAFVCAGMYIYLFLYAIIFLCVLLCLCLVHINECRVFMCTYVYCCLHAIVFVFLFLYLCYCVRYCVR